MAIKKVLLLMLSLLLSTYFVSAAITDGIVSGWTFDNGDIVGGVNLSDRADSNTMNISTNVTTGASGIVGEAFNFSNSGGYMEAAHNNNFNVSNFTINIWLNATAFTDFALVSKGTTGVEPRLAILTTGATNTTRLEINGVYTAQCVGGYNLNRWTMITATRNGTHDVLYVNGTECNVAADAAAQQYTATPFRIGINTFFANYVGGKSPPGAIDELVFWNRTLSSTEVANLYSNYTAGISLFADTTTLYITAADEWNGSSVPAFSVNVSWANGTAETRSSNAGIVQFTDLTVGGTNYNITFWNVTNYFNRVYTDQLLLNGTNNTFVGQLHNAEVCFNATAKVSEAGVIADNYTINGIVRPSCFNISAGSYSVMAVKTGWYSRNQTFVITSLQDDTQTVVNMSYANLTISAIDGSTGATLTNYDISVKSIDYTSWTGEIATGTQNHSFFLVNGTYNVSVDVPGYELTGAAANVTVSGHTNYTFTLYRQNSIRITIRDEITNELVTTNVTARFTNSDNATTWENTTNTSYLFLYNLTPSVYAILFYGSGYAARTYTVTVGARSSQTLTAYMIGSNYSTTFTIKDTDTADTISNVSISMYKLINSSWAVVESKYSDISGRSIFYYDPIGSYKFYLSKPEYSDYVFFLNPILFSSYDVYMTRTGILNASQDFEGVAVIYAPVSFPVGANTTFNFIISSPDGLLTEYGINLTYPGGSDEATGYNAIGSQLSAWVNITNATAYDRVRLDYYYISTTTGRHNFTAYFPIEFNVSASDLTFLSNKNKTYGLGIFERLLIVTLVVLFVVGIGTMVGQPIPALGLGLFVFGYMAYIGFCPLWAILPSMLVGVLFLVWKSGGY